MAATPEPAPSSGVSVTTWPVVFQPEPMEAVSSVVDGTLPSCVSVKGPLALVSPALFVAVTFWLPVADVEAPQV